MIGMFVGKLGCQGGCVGAGVALRLMVGLLCSDQCVCDDELEACGEYGIYTRTLITGTKKLDKD